MNSDSASVLIVGIDSQIGDYLETSLALQGYMVTGSSRRIVANERQQKDIIFIDLNLNSLELPNRQFDVAIICAGMNMAMCKEYPVESERINVKNTIQLIDMLLSKGIHVIFLSSNSVFNGSKAFYKYTDFASPTSNYGMYKLQVEEFLQTNERNASILRLTKVLTPKSSFTTMWEKYISEGKRFDIFNNHFLSPVSMDAVAKAVALLIEKKKGGIYQLSGEQEISYFDFAQKYFAGNVEALNLIEEQVDWNQPTGKHNSLEIHLPD